MWNQHWTRSLTRSFYMLVLTKLGKLSPSEIANKIVNLAREIESSTDAQVIKSELVTRSDLSASGDVDDVNKRLRKFCNQRQWHFIRHANIHSTDLNRGGLHLGEKGIAKMYNNFANKLDECNWLTRRPFNSERNRVLGNLFVCHEFLLSKRGFKLASLNIISKIQLVVYHQSCVLIGWATSRLYVIAH